MPTAYREVPSSVSRHGGVLVYSLRSSTSPRVGSGVELNRRQQESVQLLTSNHLSLIPSRTENHRNRDAALQAKAIMKREPDTDCITADTIGMLSSIVLFLSPRLNFTRGSSKKHLRGCSRLMNSQEPKRYSRRYAIRLRRTLPFGSSWPTGTQRVWHCTTSGLII